MMILTDTYYLFALLISNVLLLAAASIAVIRFQQQCRQFVSFWSSPTGASIAEMKSVQTQQEILVCERLEQRLLQMQTEINAMVKNPPNPSTLVERQPLIDTAARMASQGASIKDLSRNCGLNVGEARLMQKLHRVSSTSV